MPEVFAPLPAVARRFSKLIATKQYHFHLTEQKYEFKHSCLCNPAKKQKAPARHGQHSIQIPAHHEAHSLSYYRVLPPCRSEEHTSELQSLMRISYAVFCLKTKIQLT